MNVSCVICSELLTPSGDICCTLCGHIFHYACLQSWLKRSKTCPQCRVKTTNQRIKRIYLNFSNDDNVVKDSVSLQNEVDILNVQLKLRNDELNKLTKDNVKSRNEIAHLKQKIFEVEHKISSTNKIILIQKGQIKCYELLCSNIKEENEKLKEKIKYFQNIQNLIDVKKRNEMRADVRWLLRRCAANVNLSLRCADCESSTIQTFSRSYRGPARASAAPVRDIFSAGYLLREARGLRSPLITTATNLLAPKSRLKLPVSAVEIVEGTQKKRKAGQKGGKPPTEGSAFVVGPL
ncbi:TRAF-interacting protein [Cyphomyrmex costatus]|uniref:TRAF-interacting protein n=1 Tax=Cyphomyrmex costatus TaxID=456900 RepID=A0A195CUT5_9HYME|nr:TRAF-interacting protein [Cyphomyrmex costatus]